MTIKHVQRYSLTRVSLVMKLWHTECLPNEGWYNEFLGWTYLLENPSNSTFSFKWISIFINELYLPYPRILYTPLSHVLEYSTTHYLVVQTLPPHKDPKYNIQSVAQYHIDITAICCHTKVKKEQRKKLNRN